MGSILPNRRLLSGEKPMSDNDKNKQIIQNFVQVLWNDRDLSALKDFWAEDCVNHAMPGTDNRGLNALRIYSNPKSFMRSSHR
jgi:hypothetical protein